MLQMMGDLHLELTIVAISTVRTRPLRMLVVLSPINNNIYPILIMVDFKKAYHLLFKRLK
jgi:hypothetical protein